jgi:hypothetical protein
VLTCIKHNAGGKEEEREMDQYKMRNKIIRNEDKEEEST